MHDEDGGDQPGDDAPSHDAGWTDPAPDDESGPRPPADDLDGFETGMSRLAGRIARWVAGLLAVVLVVPVVGWAADELAFRRRSAAVEDVAADLADAVYLVRTVGCDGGNRSGSAFVTVLDGEQVLVTNRHVVEDVGVLSVRALSGGSAIDIEAVALAEGADVAVLRVAAPDDLPRAMTIGDRPQRGDPVRLIGFPSARPFTTAGTVGEVAPGRVLLELEVDPGASGSPVVDDEGTVVAQVFARTEDGLGVATTGATVARAIRDAEPADPTC